MGIVELWEERGRTTVPTACFKDPWVVGLVGQQTRGLKGSNGSSYLNRKERTWVA